MLRRLSLLVSSTIATIAVIVGAIYLFADDSESGSSRMPVTNDSEPTQLPEDFEKELAGSGITYTLMEGPPSDSATNAHEAVLNGFGGILKEEADYVVQHVRFTDENYGPVDDPDAPNPTVTPYFTDREALMVVLAHQTLPVSHPANVNMPKSVDAEDLPESVEGTFVAFVDMESNEVLRAVSFGA